MTSPVSVASLPAETVASMTPWRSPTGNSTEAAATEVSTYRPPSSPSTARRSAMRERSLAAGPAAMAMKRGSNGTRKRASLCPSALTTPR